MGNYRSKSQIDDKVMVTMTQMMVMMISFISMFKHAKGCGESALLALQVFVTREVILLRCGHVAPCPYAARRASKKQNVSKVLEPRGATTWIKISAFPLSI